MNSALLSMICPFTTSSRRNHARRAMDHRFNRCLRGGCLPLDPHRCTGVPPVHEVGGLVWPSDHQDGGSPPCAGSVLAGNPGAYTSATATHHRLPFRGSQ